MRRFLPFVVIGICVVSAYFINTRSRLFDTYASYCVYPVLAVQQIIMKPVHAFFENRVATQELAAQILVLQQEKEALLAELIQLRAMGAYMDSIAEIIEFKTRYEYQDSTLVRVLLRHISEQEHFFLVSAGSEHGIEKDMIAVYKNSLVGRVVAVYPWYSKLLLITDRSCKIAAHCSQTDAVGIHEGTNETDKAALTRVSHLSQVADGDFVVSTGDGLIFPKGFALGKIAHTEVDGLFYQITVTPIFDVTTIDYCYLMRKAGA